MDARRNYFVLVLLVGCLAADTGNGAAADPQATTATQILAKLAPLPDNVQRTIMNPYHADPAWKLWALDPSPVTINKPHFKGTFQLPKAVRKVPVFLLKRGVSELTLEPLGKGPQAGFWDDCYMSLDNHHTRLSQPRGQFIDGGKMQTAQDVDTLLKLGVNFTSQSYADRGRAIVDDMLNNLNTERHFFFANCIRATPSHVSYEDKDEDKVTDLYDGLFAHSYHSLGQSGSEMNALYKMMLAGACMPRSTKNLLKRHGAYAIVLLTLFKAALPYTDALGRALPFEHELRHRPVYSSHGTPPQPHYCPANAHYHGYDEKTHLQGMMDLARDLEHAPPIAVARLLRFSVEKGGGTVTDPVRLRKQIKCLALTQMRFWGGDAETLDVRIDLNMSYDLQHSMLNFHCRSLYPNQKNVSIRQELPGVFHIRVKHDPNLPKGRIPVICTVTNDLTPLPSNPVFINFYWPQENEFEDYVPMWGAYHENRKKLEARGLKQLPVTVNRRPVVDFGFAGDALHCSPGQSVSFDLKAHDPEGFPVTVFRRSGQIGTLTQDRFIAAIPSTDRNKIYRIHFVFSDGTGGYTGKQIKLLVSDRTDSLPKEWMVSALGPVSRRVSVRYVDGTFTFGRQPIHRQAGLLQGTFVFQPYSGTVDLGCRIPTIPAGAEMALLITNTLDDATRRAGVGFSQGKVFGVTQTWERYELKHAHQWSEKRSKKVDTFRMIGRDGLTAGYVSTGRGIWEQICVGKLALFDSYYAGLLYRGEPWTEGVCQWLPPAGSKLPILSTGTKQPQREGHFDSPLEITISSPHPSTVLRYTLDGSQPTDQSPLYEEPIKLIQAGRHEIRVRTFEEGTALDTTVAVFNLK